MPNYSTVDNILTELDLSDIWEDIDQLRKSTDRDNLQRSACIWSDGNRLKLGDVVIGNENEVPVPQVECQGRLGTFHTHSRFEDGHELIGFSASDYLAFLHHDKKLSIMCSGKHVAALGRRENSPEVISEATHQELREAFYLDFAQ